METYIDSGGNFVTVLMERARWKFLFELKPDGTKVWCAVRRFRRKNREHVTTVKLPDSSPDYFISTTVKTPTGIVLPLTSNVPEWVFNGLNYYQCFGLDDDGYYYETDEDDQGDDGCPW